jgi:hypothetical protein
VYYQDHVKICISNRLAVNTTHTITPESNMDCFLIAAADPKDLDAVRTAGALACPLLCLAPILVFGLVVVVALWKVFEKAGQPGWAAIVPIYNGYVLTCGIAKKEVMWFIMQFIPFIGIYASFVLSLDVAKRFGRSEGFGVGLFFLPFIFYPILAFGDARYQGGRALVSYDDDDEDDRPRRRPRRDDADMDDEDDRRPRRRNQRFDDDNDDLR